VPLTVKGLGLGREGRMSPWRLVDEGVLRLTHQKNPDPDRLVLRQAARSASNYRDDYGRLLDPQTSGRAGAVNFGGDEFGGAGLTVGADQEPWPCGPAWSTPTPMARATIRLPGGRLQTGQPAAWWRLACDRQGRWAGRGPRDMTVAPAGGWPNSALPRFPRPPAITPRRRSS